MSTLAIGKVKHQKSYATSHKLTFCLFWSVMTTISLFVNALLWGRVLDERQVIFISLAFIAAIITAFIAWHLESWLTSKKAPTARFAAMFILLGTGTIGATFLMSALYTLPFFVDSMNPFTTDKGIEDLYYFFLSHGYSFAVSTARLFLPLGLISLILTSIFYCILCQSADERL